LALDVTVSADGIFAFQSVLLK